MTEYIEQRTAYSSTQRLISTNDFPSEKLARTTIKESPLELNPAYDETPDQEEEDVGEPAVAEETEQGGDVTIETSTASKEGAGVPLSDWFRPWVLAKRDIEHGMATRTINIVKYYVNNVTTAILEENASVKDSVSRATRYVADIALLPWRTLGRCWRFLLRRARRQMEFASRLIQAAPGYIHTRRRMLSTNAGQILRAFQQVAVETCLLPFTILIWMFSTGQRAAQSVANLPGAALSSLRDKTRHSVERVREMAQQQDELAHKVTDSLETLSHRGMDMMAQRSRSTLEAARATLDAARDSTWEAARATLGAVGVSKDAPCCLSTRVVTYGIQGLLNIQELQLALRLSVARKQYIKGSMNTVIQGKQETFNFDFNARSVADLKRAIWRMLRGKGAVGPEQLTRRSSSPRLHDGVTGLPGDTYGRVQNGYKLPTEEGQGDGRTWEMNNLAAEKPGQELSSELHQRKSSI